MGVSTFRWVTQDVGETDIGSEVGAADKRGSGARIRSCSLGSAQTKLQQHAPITAFPDTRGLGGDQGLEIELVEERGFQDLSHCQGTLDDGERDIGVDYSTFGNGLYGDPFEGSIFVNPTQEVIVKEAEMKAAKVLEGAHNDLLRLTNEVTALNARKDSLIGRLRVLLSSELDMIKSLDMGGDTTLSTSAKLEGTGKQTLELTDVLKKIDDDGTAQTH